MKKILLCSLMFFLSISQNAFSQSKFILEEYSPNIDKVFDSNNVIYYGVDMSMVKLTNPMKIGQDDFIRHYLYAWVSTFEKELPPEKYISKWLKKEGFTFEPDDVQKRTELVDKKWIIRESYSFSIEQLKEIIQSYELQQDNGLGFVINAENFNKSHEYMTLYYTFFDIKSRKILWTTKIKGVPGGWGMNGFWSNGLTNSIKIYIDKCYKKRYKNHKSS
ncbi:MAG: hypothetical protein KQH79_11455 [Bacteroidetes bacterium]|nr:hypothetical protein [Bacteroidota bacterium]